jgi:hypothetical protein
MFQYAIVIIILLYIFLKLTIHLNIILALILALIIIFYSYEKDIVQNKLEETENQLKYDTIKPTLDNVEPNSLIIDFLFTVQDFYAYNPQAYEEMIANLEAFYSVTETIFHEEVFSTYYYQIAVSKKNNALNSFHSIIFKLPSDTTYTDKFNRAHERLETILNYRLNDAYDQCQAYLIKNGYNSNMTPLEIGPMGYNVYNNNDYTYQFY